MENENFFEKRKWILREHKRAIVRAALNGRRLQGRGLVMVTVATPGMMRLSYLSLETLKRLEAEADPMDQGYQTMLVEKLLSYRPDSEIPLVITDGESRQYSLGVKRPSQANLQQRT